MFYIITQEGIFDNLKAFMTNNYGELADKLEKELTSGDINEDKLEKMHIKFLDPNEIMDLINLNDFYKEISKVVNFLTIKKPQPSRDDIERASTDFLEGMQTSLANLIELKKKKFESSEFTSNDIKDTVKIIKSLEIIEKNTYRNLNNMQVEKIINALVKGKVMFPGLGQFQDTTMTFRQGFKYLNLVVNSNIKISKILISKYINVLRKATKSLD